MANNSYRGAVAAVGRTRGELSDLHEGDGTQVNGRPRHLVDVQVSDQYDGRRISHRIRGDVFDALAWLIWRSRGVEAGTLRILSVESEARGDSVGAAALDRRPRVDRPGRNESERRHRGHKTSVSLS